MAIRTYKVTLDTKNSIAPEPVFLRQGDKTGAVVIDAVLMDNGAPVSLEGLTPMFKANTADGQAVIADSTGFNIVNASGGEFTYQVPNALSSVPGKIKVAYFSFLDSSGAQSTFNVVFFVEKAADMAQDNAKDWVSNLNEIIDQYNQWVNNAHSSWQDFVNENKEIIESIDPGGKLIGELIDARRPFGGEAYPTLGERLDSEKAEVSAQLAQTPKTINKPSSQSVWQEFEDRAINVKWFGAKGNARYFDDVTKKYYADSSFTEPPHDDTEAIKQAIASAYQQHIPIFFPRGYYYISETITLPLYQHLTGSGTVQGSAIVTDKPIHMINTEDRASFIKMENLLIQGVRGVVLSGLTVNSTKFASFFTMIDCEIKNFSQYCMELQNFAGGLIYDSVFRCGGEYGIKVKNTYNSRMDNVLIADSGTNLYAEGGTGLKLYNAYFTTEPELVGQYGVVPTTKLAHLVNTSFFKFYDCKFETVTDDVVHDVLLESDASKFEGDQQVVDNEFHKCQWVSLNKNGHNITISATDESIREPRRTRIYEPEFMQPKNNFYDVNLIKGSDTIITRPITKTDYRTGLLLDPIINNPNNRSYTLIKFKGEETVSTSNGHYTKFPNGLLISVTYIKVDCTDTSPQTFQNSASFLMGSPKSCSFSIDNPVDITSATESVDIVIGMTSGTESTIVVRKLTNGTITDLQLRVTTIGRWKV